ncbi:WD40-repeat-containing domain protein, partial [Powellomyces hirtus]
MLPFTAQQLVEFEDCVMAIGIHGTDRLIPDIRCQQPLVRVHIVDTLTGRYIRKLDPQRKVTTQHEAENVNYVLPMMTKVFAAHRGEISPSWGETLIFNEPYLPLLSNRTMIMFEILNFVVNKELLARGTDGYHRVAWAYLKLLSSNNQPNTQKKARLQLYKYPPPEIDVTPDGPTQPSIYKVFCLRKHKYPSTLYVTVYGHQPIPPRNVLRRPELPTEVEVGRETLQQWQRRPGQRCKIPNKLMYRISTTKYAADPTAFTCAFSHDGEYIAIACTDQSNACVIKIYRVLTGERVAVLEGHQNLIYSVMWLNDDAGLVSTSSDGSARIWNVDQSGRLMNAFVTVLQHPAYAYTADIHPLASEPRLIVTGCYDAKIRIWPIVPGKKSIKPMQILSGHDSNVNSVVFDKDGARLYSADGDGIIRVWNSQAEGAASMYVCIKAIELFQGTPINALRMHSQNRRILVHLGSHLLHTLDVRLYRILT